MQALEKEFTSLCTAIADEQEAEKAKVPLPADVHTIKQLLEFSQECKREGNAKFKDGSYDEALFIYNQACEAIGKWKIGDHLTNEKEWVDQYHLACQKNKAQA